MRKTDINTTSRSVLLVEDRNTLQQIAASHKAKSSTKTVI